MEGEIRLAGGKADMDGRVEVCGSYSRWGTVCNKQWAPSHTMVVCRQLGYSDTKGNYIIMLMIIAIYCEISRFI